MQCIATFPDFRLRRFVQKRIANQNSLRLGNDLVWIPDVQSSVSAFGERYLRRIFTPRELHDCRGSERNRFASLAARIAAKEAVMKLLRPSRDTAMPWLAIEVVRHADGHPVLKLHSTAADMAHQAGLSGYAVSLSHDHEYAMATVIATSQFSKNTCQYGLPRSSGNAVTD